MAPKGKAVLKKPAAATKHAKTKAAEPEEDEIDDEGEDDEEEDGNDEDEEEEEEEAAIASPPSRGSSQKAATYTITRRTEISVIATGQQASPEGTSLAIASASGTSSSPPGGKSSSRSSPPKRKQDETQAVAGVILVAKKALPISYEIEGDAGNDLCEGLVRLRRQAHLCDAAVVCGGGARIAVHRVVMAAASTNLNERLQLSSELDLGKVSHEAADFLVRWIYGEVSSTNYRPSTVVVNEEVLQLASEFGMPKLSELGSSRLALGVTISNVVGRIRLCEEFGLPTLRSALVAALIADKQALMAVSQDPMTLGHPALMRELLSAIATRATEVADNTTTGKRARSA